MLTGENDFEIDRAVGVLVDQFDGTVEKLDGTELTLNQLPDIFMGVSLFADRRLVMIRNLSANAAVWSALPDWLERISDDVQLILIEPKPDKRTKTYKTLQKSATIQEYDAWKEWDTRKAEVWALEEAKHRQLNVTPAIIRHLVGRTGADQWRLHHALEKLSVLPAIDQAVIDELVELHPAENVFQLFDTALRGDVAGLDKMLGNLRQTTEPHAVLGLLTGQLFQLMALRYGPSTTNEIAKDMAVKPYVLQKLKPFATRLSPPQARQLVNIFADADSALKQSAGDPWTIVESALFEVAAI